MRSWCTSLFRWYIFSLGDQGSWFKVQDRLLHDLDIRCWIVCKFRALVSGNSVRIELFWFNVCCRFVRMIPMISFIFEVIGPTYGKHFIVLFWSAFGFVLGLSQLGVTHFMLRVMWFLEADLVKDSFCWCRYIRLIWLIILLGVISEGSLCERICKFDEYFGALVSDRVVLHSRMTNQL